MRTLHLSKMTEIAGSERHLLSLLPGLQARGVEVELLILEDPRRAVPQVEAAFRKAGVPTQRLPIRQHLDLATLWKLTALLRDRKPDLLHTHLLHGDLYGLIAARRAGIAAVVSSRHNDDSFRRRALFRLFNRALMRRADAVIAISEALGRFVREVEQAAPEKVRVIPYGLDAPQNILSRAEAQAALGLKDEGPLIGFFGRLVRQKGLDVLIAAFALLSERHPGARLLIVGDGPLRGEFEKLAARLNRQGSILFKGWLPGASQYMPACNLIVVPSRWEGFGLVTLEAMHQGLPLVASRASALPEIVADGETGLLVPPEDVGALFNALDRVLGSPEMAQSMGKAGRERVLREFSVSRMVDSTLALYQSLPGQKTRG